MATTNVRIPDDIHARLREAAVRDRRSLNAQIVHYIERGLSEDQDRHDSPPA